MIVDTLKEDLKTAMKSKDAVRLRTIRSLRSAIMAKEIDLRSDGQGSISEEAAMEVLQKQAKQRRDSIAQYIAAGREDLRKTEEEELKVIESYLPKQLSEEEIIAAVQDMIQATGASGMKDMGRVMGQAMSQLKGKADGSIVQKAARSLLSS